LAMQQIQNCIWQCTVVICTRNFGSSLQKVTDTAQFLQIWLSFVRLLIKKIAWMVLISETRCIVQ
jgi:hypothetical protein